MVMDGKMLSDRSKTKRRPASVAGRVRSYLAARSFGRAGQVYKLPLVGWHLVSGAELVRLRKQIEDLRSMYLAAVKSNKIRSRMYDKLIRQKTIVIDKGKRSRK